MNASDPRLLSDPSAPDHRAASPTDVCLNDEHFRRARQALARGDYTTAAVAALTSARRHHHHPEAHFLAGFALLRLDLIDAAEGALLEAVRQRPAYPEAHLRLAYIYRKHRVDFFKVGEHQQLAVKAERTIRGGRNACVAA